MKILDLEFDVAQASPVQCPAAISGFSSQFKTSSIGGKEF